MMLSILSIFEFDLLLQVLLGKMFQKRRVSSPAPVTMVLPSGLMARQSTRQVWPVSVASFCISGYRQTLISFWEQPWVLTSSFRDLLNIRLQTCEPASQELMVVPVSVLRTLIVRSAVPPPETRRPCWWGDQAMALTAARWSVNLTMGSVKWVSQMRSLLSLPPEQSCCSSKDHFRPQIYCLCPVSLLTNWVLVRMSRCRMVLSRDPVLSRLELQLIAPTRMVWPVRVVVSFSFSMSQICTSPLLVPRETCGVLVEQATEVAIFCTPRSHNLVTLELLAFQRQTLVASPTARQFCGDQSRRLRQKSSWRAGASRTLMGNLLIFRLLFLKLDSFWFISRVSAFSRAVSSFSMFIAWSLYRSRLQFSKLSMLLDFTGVEQSSITYLRYRSGSRSSLLSTLEGCRFGSSLTERQSGFSNFLLGMKRST